MDAMYALQNAAVYASVHGGPHDDWGGGYWWIWRLGMLLLWIVLIGLAIWWFRRCGRGWAGRHEHHEVSGVERARGILAERFARGEINAEEYRERLGQLS
jgi:putative membrane protein